MERIGSQTKFRRVVVVVALFANGYVSGVAWNESDVGGGGRGLYPLLQQLNEHLPK
jgi:hypothetical protein